MSDQPKPTPGAVRAAKIIAHKIYLGTERLGVGDYATIIDRETAAPELLEACYMACEQLDEWGRGENRENVEANNAEICRVVRAAIAKAKAEK